MNDNITDNEIESMVDQFLQEHADNKFWILVPRADVVKVFKVCLTDEPAGQDTVMYAVTMTKDIWPWIEARKAPALGHGVQERIASLVDEAVQDTQPFSAVERVIILTQQFERDNSTVRAMIGFARQKYDRYPTPSASNDTVVYFELDKGRGYIEVADQFKVSPVELVNSYGQYRNWVDRWVSVQVNRHGVRQRGYGFDRGFSSDDRGPRADRGNYDSRWNRSSY